MEALVLKEKKKRDGAIRVRYKLELQSRNVKQPISSCKVVAHVCHPNTKEDPEFEASLSYTRETLVSIPRLDSKVSVRMLMQAFVSVSRRAACDYGHSRDQRSPTFRY